MAASVLQGVTQRPAGVPQRLKRVVPEGLIPGPSLREPDLNPTALSQPFFHAAEPAEGFQTLPQPLVHGQRAQRPEEVDQGGHSLRAGLGQRLGGGLADLRLPVRQELDESGGRRPDVPADARQRPRGGGTHHRLPVAQEQHERRDSGSGSRANAGQCLGTRLADVGVLTAQPAGQRGDGGGRGGADAPGNSGRDHLSAGFVPVIQSLDEPVHGGLADPDEQQRCRLPDLGEAAAQFLDQARDAVPDERVARPVRVDLFEGSR